MMYNFPFFTHFYPRFRHNYPQNIPKNVNSNPFSYPASYPMSHYHNRSEIKSYHNPSYQNKSYHSTNYLNNSKDGNNNQSERNNTFRQKNIINKKPSFPDINNNSYPKENSNKEDKSLDTTDTIFEIFGIKLHFDDILLICLIFFLYNEGVKDEFLFVALILLLLS